MKIRNVILVVAIIIAAYLYQNIAQYLCESIDSELMHFVLMSLMLLAFGTLIGYWYYGPAFFEKGSSPDANNKEAKKKKYKKTLKDYLQETTFTFDSEDENLLISKVNPNLMIRVISGGSRDEITFGFNFPHNFGNQTETFVKENISECERLTTVNSTHSVVFVKGPGAKWGVIGQQLVETMFSIYVNKYLFS